MPRGSCAKHRFVHDEIGRQAASNFEKLVKGTDLSVVHMPCFGKGWWLRSFLFHFGGVVVDANGFDAEKDMVLCTAGFIKKCNLSPDAFVQVR